MNERTLLVGDLVNWYIVEDGEKIKCFGKVLKPSLSPVIEVFCIYRGTKKLCKTHTIEKEQLIICK